MSNVLLDRIEAQVNMGLIDYQKNGAYNFRITDEIRFNDEIWDFNAFNESKRERFQYRFDFNSISEMFWFGLKMVILNRLFRKSTDFSTVKNNYNDIKNFGNFCEEENIKDLRLLNVDSLKGYFEQRTKDISNGTRIHRANTLKEVLEMCDKYNIYDGKVLIKYLEDFIKKHPEKRNLTSKNEYIPDVLFNQIVSLAVIDLNDTKIAIRDRIIAGHIIMLAEIGMRVEEASMLETNKLKSIGEGDLKVYYLQFYTFKITPNGEEKRLTYSFLTDLALSTYKKLCELRDEIILGLSEMTKLRLIIQIKEDIRLKGYKNLIELTEIVSKYTEKERAEIEKEINRFTFISSETGLQKRGGLVLTDNTKEFYVRHAKDFDLKMLSNSQIEDVKKFMLTSETKYNKFFNAKEREEHPFEEVKKNLYVYINPHRFRVTVCTKLFLKGIHLDYIVRHLNHLSEDMTMYYNKSLEFQKSLEDTVDIFFENATDDGLIEIDPDKAKEGVLKEELKVPEFRENIDKINQFIQRNKFNINSDMKKIMRLLKKTNSPVMENSLGVCIVSVVQKVCERRKYFSSLDDNYYIGIQLETYKDVNYSYKRFKQKIDVIKHNKEISDENPELKNEYEREVNALSYYVKKTLIKELDLLESDINHRGEKALLDEYPDLHSIIYKFKEIRGEVSEWT
ncbi:tyrosine-type recombinase/integrase [Clostridium akagii]|uniref:tyrosine-type recombinase/integrase n=1 Tax=Clostridium akagii TaxID=91623 RepID=UPI000478873E|nr:tyrosine-type recombinase/integrase [Clostridium akagii]